MLLARHVISAPVCLLIFGLIYASSCHQVALEAQSSLNRPPLISRVAVDQIVLCELEHPFDDKVLTPLGVVLKDDKVLDHAIASLNKGAPASGFPFVGVLCYQVYLDSGSNVLAVTHIVNYDATILFDSGVQREGKFYLSQNGTNEYAERRSVPFAQAIFDALHRDLPGYIQEQDKAYRRDAGKSLAEMLGVRGVGPNNNE